MLLFELYNIAWAFSFSKSPVNLINLSQKYWIFKQRGCKIEKINQNKLILWFQDHKKKYEQAKILILNLRKENKQLKNELGKDDECKVMVTLI